MTTTCQECGGRLATITGPGRTQEWRPAAKMPIPSSFEVPTCEDCGEEFISDAGEVELMKSWGDGYATTEDNDND